MLFITLHNGQEALRVCCTPRKLETKTFQFVDANSDSQLIVFGSVSSFSTKDKAAFLKENDNVACCNYQLTVKKIFHRQALSECNSVPADLQQSASYSADEIEAWISEAVADVESNPQRAVEIFLKIREVLTPDQIMYLDYANNLLLCAEKDSRCWLCFGSQPIASHIIASTILKVRSELW